MRTDDDDLHVKLDDWPQSGSNPRSPKYLFAKDDNIFVKLTGPQGMGNDKLKVKVTSESDTTGLTFDLAEISPGVYVNKSPAKPLRLGNQTEVKSDSVTIKVVDREVLKFAIVFNGVESSGPDVMVAKAKFAGAGIAVFWGSSTGDRATVRTEALTNARFFDAGDGFSDLHAGIKNAGANFPETHQASFYHFSSHGDGINRPNGEVWGTGILVDVVNGASTTIIDPGASDGINNNTDWNKDVKWVILDSCLNIDYRGAGGKEKWMRALNGNPCPAHGILGAWDSLDADLRAHNQRFWQLLRTQTTTGEFTTVPSAYLNAMERTNPPQPWAMMYHETNGSDQIKKMTRDDRGSSFSYSFVHIEPKPNYGRATAEPVTEADTKIDNGRGLIRKRATKASEVPSAENTTKQLAPIDLSAKKPRFAARIEKRADGSTDFSGEQSFHAKSSISQDAAVELALSEIKKEFPELHPHLKLVSVGSRGDQKFDATGKMISNAATGYVIHFKVMAGSLPVAGDYVIVSVFGDKVGAIAAKGHVETAEKSGGKAKLLGVEEALKKGLNSMKEDIGIKGDYEISDCELVYCNPHDFAGKSGLTRAEHVAAWKVKVNPNFVVGKVGETKEIWIDALSGRYLGVTK